MSKKLKRNNLFAKDVSSLLYAYGDVPQPLQESIQCLDDLVAAYLADICTSASKTAQNSKRNKLKLEDFKFALRHDPIKLGRSEELIATNKLIAEAKKQFNSTDSQSLKKAKEGDEDDEEDEDEDDLNDNHASSERKRKSADGSKQAKPSKNKQRKLK